MSSVPSGLRERRRRETQHEIHAAALRLAREHGFDKVTVEMISAEAGVSPRTFFNYFPTKEAAVVWAPMDPSAELVAEFVAAGPAHPRTVLADLTRLLMAHLAEHPPERAEIRDIFALADRHPAILAGMLAQLDAFHHTLAAAVAQRTGERVGDEVPTLVAAVAMAAVRAGMERWSQGDPADQADTPVPYVERAMALLRTLVADHE